MTAKTAVGPLGCAVAPFVFQNRGMFFHVPDGPSCGSSLDANQIQWSDDL
jgi:hypothetical protein